ncbi:MAG: hypothetical protein ABIJ09_22400 [Pseudomonadota bacterium]
MKNTILAICALLAATAALATVGLQARRIHQLELQVQGGAPAASDEGDTVLPGEGSCLQRVQALESRMAQLQTRMARRELGQGALPKTARHAPTGDNAEGVDPESVLLDALDSDNPEVRERIKDVVAEEQRRLHEEHFEERRQRWAERSREQVTQLAKDHNLSEEQTSQLNAHLDQEREQIRSLFEQGRGELGFRGMREQMQALRATTDKAVKEVLDEDQYTGYQKMREEQGPRFGGRGWGGGGPPRPEGR